MIDRVDRELCAWLADIVGDDVEVGLQAPGDPAGKPVVRAYLLELVEGSHATGGARPAPVRVGLRYLITTSAPAAERAHALLSQVLVAAAERGDAELSLVAAGDPVWLALGVAPRPALRLQLAAEWERPWQPAPRVRQRIVQQRPLVAVTGVLLGPEDIPLGRASVELVGLGRTAVTDAAGRFRFEGVPAGHPVHSVRVRARGFEASLGVEGDAASDRPLTLRLERLEG